MRQVAFTLQIIKTSVEKRVIYIIFAIWDWFCMEEKICNKKLYEIINDFAIAAEVLQMNEIFKGRAEYLTKELDRRMNRYMGSKSFTEEKKQFIRHLIEVNLGMSDLLHKHQFHCFPKTKDQILKESFPCFFSKSFL